MKYNKQRICWRYKAALCVTGFALFIGLGACGLPGGNSAEQEITMIQEEIVIPGLSKEYDFLFITDSHVVVPDEKVSEQEAAYSAGRYPMFRNEEGVSAADLLHDLMAYANREKVDAVLLGGDIIDYPSSANFDYLKKELKKLKAPYLYTLGNHDWTYPWEYMSDAGKEAYLPLFAPYMEGNTAIHTWETDDLRVIAVDNCSGQVNPDALESYEELLNTEKPVIVLVHVPFSAGSLTDESKVLWDSPVVIGSGEGEIVPEGSTEEFMELTFAEDSPVELVLAGHVHSYNKDYICGEKNVLQIVGDAAFHGSAVRLRVRGGEAPSEK